MDKTTIQRLNDAIGHLKDVRIEIALALADARPEVEIDHELLFDVVIFERRLATFLEANEGLFRKIQDREEE